MEYTTLGKTGLKVSVAGLGGGGFSRLGLSAGGTEDEAALVVREAFDMGISFVDTAPIYGTEAIVGKALKQIPRDSVVVATKASVGRNGERQTSAQMVESLEKSLRLLSTDYIDVFQLHDVPISAYTYARETLVPSLIEQKAKGKIRHIGITELATEDDQHEMLSRAAYDDLWDVFMIAFHMMHQSARKTIFPLTRERQIGTLLMFAVRSIFAKPERVAVAMREAAAKGLVEKRLGRTDEPLAFLIQRAVPATSPRQPTGLSDTNRESTWCCSGPAMLDTCVLMSSSFSSRHCLKPTGRGCQRSSATWSAWEWMPLACKATNLV